MKLGIGRSVFIVERNKEETAAGRIKSCNVKEMCWSMCPRYLPTGNSI